MANGTVEVQNKVIINSAVQSVDELKTLLLSHIEKCKGRSTPMQIQCMSGLPEAVGTNTLFGWLYVGSSGNPPWAQFIGTVSTGAMIVTITYRSNTFYVGYINTNTTTI